MYREKKQTNRFGFKIVRLTCIYATVAFAVCFCILAGLNNTVVFADTTSSPLPAASGSSADTTSNSISVSSSAAPSATEKPAITLTGVPVDAQNIAFSYDDKYCTYMAGSQLYIKELSTGNTAKTISASGGIRWPVLMSDRNILIYFTVSGSSLSLNTYNIDNGQSTKQTSFTFPSGAKIKAVDYSNFTNLVFVNLADTKNASEKDTVYSINIMKNVQKLSLTSVVDNMVLLGKANSLYYNDSKNNLYLHGKPFAGVQAGKLLGRDSEDNVYVQSADSKEVYMISNEQLGKTLALTDTNYMKIYADQKSVYAVYSDYIINLSGDMQTKLQYDKSLIFLGMGGKNAYFRDKNNNIIGLQSSIG